MKEIPIENLKKGAIYYFVQVDSENPKIRVFDEIPWGGKIDPHYTRHLSPSAGGYITKDKNGITHAWNSDNMVDNESGRKFPNVRINMEHIKKAIERSGLDIRIE